MIFFTRRFFTDSGTNIGNLDVGTEIILNENGAPVNYLIVNQGIPSSSGLYDASCNGSWCLRKDIAENRQWNSSNSNAYGPSTINAYLNGDWLDRYDPNVLEAIVQAKIPYVNGTGNSPVASGANGLSCKAFLLGGYEVGFSRSDNQNLPIDGAKLAYFEAGTGISAINKRIANLNGSATSWCLRSPGTEGTANVWRVHSDGHYGAGACSNLYGIRSTIIFPFDFKLSDSQIA